MSVQEAWNTICTLKTGSRPAKLSVLLDCIALPKGQWMGRMVKKVETLSKKESLKDSVRTYTRGELEQIHGIAEASDFINRGKYKKSVDEDGDEVFTKSVKTFEQSTERAQHLHNERSPGLLNMY